MRRRDFIKLSSVAGVAGIAGSRFDVSANPLYAQASGFDLHPFIKGHPEAVFICLTNVKEKTDKKDIYDASYKLAQEMFVSTSDGKGYPNSTKIAAKPNWTGHPPDKNDPTYDWGIRTDINFIEGFLNGVRNKGPQNFYIRECASPNRWEEHGFPAMCAKNNFDLKDLSSKDPWDLGDEIIYKEVNGTIYKEIGFMAPMTAPDSFLINLAKFKAHGMGITASIKNLQGTTAKRLHQFCSTADAFRSLERSYHRFFQPDYLTKVNELHKKHIEAGIPRWNETVARRGFSSGLYMEQWVQRMLDVYSVVPIKTAGISIVEGIYGRDGDGFGAGPHNGKAMDFMSNNVIFGNDPFRVDIITHWLAGHEPGNFGLFHIGIERGLSNVLDPFDIPVYLWKDGKAKKVKLDKLDRTPLLTYYNQKESEDRYHMCDEQFDYKSWKSTGKIAVNAEPSIKAIGTDSRNRVVMDMNVPQKGDVYVDIMNSRGELIWRMYADDLEPGVHQVVWDGFASPGLYSTYVKGMGWDAENEIVIYT
ncbi:MAG: DUF362 domain-containing protein [Bacteroidales bacterium]|jgi:hypothetical protein|nr:DUF362 domain-containing protein [Bacteroidales bacterium]